jgi:LysM repeat protein
MRFKILVFVLTLALLGGTFLAAYWFYDTIDQPERLAEQQLLRRQQQTNKGPVPDPSAPSFQKINDALAAGQLEDVHEQLNRLLKVYPDSPWETEARRMLGEMNVDRLFSRSPMPGKRDYIVKSGDSLAKIEKGSLTTIPFLKRLNNLTSLNLQPGDRLVYQPLEFELEVRLADEVLTVRQKAAAGLDPIFFKNYRLTAVAVAPTFPKVLKTQIQEKPAWVGDRKVLATDPQYAFARKQLLTTGRPGRPGVLFRPDSERVTVPTGGVSAAVQGIFLDDGDLEELSTILRTGTPVVILRQ